MMHASDCRPPFSEPAAVWQEDSGIHTLSATPETGPAPGTCDNEPARPGWRNGRRSGLKNRRRQLREGSTPSPGTAKSYTNGRQKPLGAAPVGLDSTSLYPYGYRMGGTAMSRRRGGGEGSIRQRRPGLWEARVTVGFDAQGRQLRRSIYGKTRADVAARMTASLAKLADGVAPASDRQKLRDFLASWIEAQTNIRPNTKRRYRGLIDHQIVPLLGGGPARSVDAAACRHGPSTSGRKRPRAPHSEPCTRRLADGAGRRPTVGDGHAKCGGFGRAP